MLLNYSRLSMSQLKSLSSSLQAYQQNKTSVFSEFVAFVCYTQMHISNWNKTVTQKNWGFNRITVKMKCCIPIHHTKEQNSCGVYHCLELWDKNLLFYFTKMTTHALIEDNVMVYNRGLHGRTRTLNQNWKQNTIISLGKIRNIKTQQEKRL